MCHVLSGIGASCIPGQVDLRKGLCVNVCAGCLATWYDMHCECMGHNVFNSCGALGLTAHSVAENAATPIQTEFAQGLNIQLTSWQLLMVCHAMCQGLLLV